MTQKAGFTLRGRNPDVLTCIANLSNDEVFTPPEFASRMLDTLAEAWAASNNGADIWADPTVTFLDPCTKSGVFLREITRRLTEGLKDQMPDLQTRVDHILTQQVFGIGITHLTSLLARRSVYCSKHANGEHSIAQSFTTSAGNIWFERVEHSWKAGKCIFCGANARDYDRGEELETHAYALIHNDDVKKRLGEIFGTNMQFDVVIGNPPYQLGQSGGEAVGNFAMPVYQKFVQAAKGLDVPFVVMVTPSRWFAGGRGLDEFRAEMLADRRLRCLVDFPESRDVFAGVDIAGGVSYFLWDSAWNGGCEVSTVIGGVAGPKMVRRLDDYDILVRRNEAISILRRILTTPDGEDFKSFASHVSPIQPFSLRTKFRGAANSAGLKDPVLIHHSEGSGYIEQSAIPRNIEWVDQWKVIVGRAVPAGGRPDKEGRYYGLLGIRVLPPGTACTETYLVANRFASMTQANNCAGYLRTKFTRFLIWLRTNTQDLYRERFAFVPDLPMGQEWTDNMLYKKYGLTNDEIAFIESMIRPIGEGDD